MIAVGLILIYVFYLVDKGDHWHLAADAWRFVVRGFFRKGHVLKTVLIALLTASVLLSSFA